MVHCTAKLQVKTNLSSYIFNFWFTFHSLTALVGYQSLPGMSPCHLHQHKCDNCIEIKFMVGAMKVVMILLFYYSRVGVLASLIRHNHNIHLLQRRREVTSRGGGSPTSHRGHLINEFGLYWSWEANWGRHGGTVIATVPPISSHMDTSTVHLNSVHG